MTREDTNFSPTTKRLIAEAVNWQCSAPLCRNPAIGADDGRTVNGGTACHIYSAAANGPRGSGGLSDAQLSHADNGLWCCAYHGRIIDANKGGSFPAAQLHMWKRLAEGRVRRAMAVEYPELGWISDFQLSVLTRAGKTWTVRHTLQKNNLICGASGSGKSLLLEALASISDSQHARRLRQFPEFSIDLSYLTLIREAKAHVTARGAGPLQRTLDGRMAILGPTDMAVLFLDPSLDQPQRDHTGVKYLKQLLRIQDEELLALAKAVSNDVNSGISIVCTPTSIDDSEPQETPADVEEDIPSFEVRVAFESGRSALHFNGLSGSERIRIGGALLIAMAREILRSRPVLLCIDSLWRLDDLAFRRELRRLGDEHLQLVVVAPRELTDEQAQKDFPGWNLLSIPSIDDALGRTR